jgi:hypothetical protein
MTTELWDFGLPPPIVDLKSQPVIDPITLSPLPMGPHTLDGT